MRHHRRPWAPPHCPNPECAYHQDSEGWRYIKAGFFLRKPPPHRVQRFRCLECRVNFSRQSFEASYWLKKPDLLQRVFWRSLSCSGLRQIARDVGTTHSTVQRLLARLGHHCLLFHERHRPRRLPDEPLVLDGFETFEFTPMSIRPTPGRFST